MELDHVQKTHHSTSFEKHKKTKNVMK